MQIRVKDIGWTAQGQNTVRVRLMLLAVVETLEEFGFGIYATLRTANRAGKGLEADMLICSRRQDGVAGGPVSAAADPEVPELVTPPLRCL